jgi:hypothetical protein
MCCRCVLVRGAGVGWVRAVWRCGAVRGQVRESLQRRETHFRTVLARETQALRDEERAFVSAWTSRGPGVPGVWPFVRTFRVGWLCLLWCVLLSVAVPLCLWRTVICAVMSRFRCTLFCMHPGTSMWGVHRMLAGCWPPWACRHVVRHGPGAPQHLFRQDDLAAAPGGGGPRGVQPLPAPRAVLRCAAVGAVAFDRAAPLLRSCDKCCLVPEVFRGYDVCVWGVCAVGEGRAGLVGAAWPAAELVGLALMDVCWAGPLCPSWACCRRCSACSRRCTPPRSASGAPCSRKCGSKRWRRTCLPCPAAWCVARHLRAPLPAGRWTRSLRVH